MPARSPDEQARELFAPLGPTYDRVGAALSLGQDPRWRRFLVARLPRGGDVLDVATGTGLVAVELVWLLSLATVVLAATLVAFRI